MSVVYIHRDCGLPAFEYRERLYPGVILTAKGVVRPEVAPGSFMGCMSCGAVIMPSPRHLVAIDDFVTETGLAQQVGRCTVSPDTMPLVIC